MRLRAVLVLTGLALMTAGCGLEEAAIALKQAETEAAALKALQRLTHEDGGDALASAFCTIVTSYIDQGKAPSDEDWANLVLARAGLPTSVVSEKANQLGAALRLAQQNSGTAHAYTQACLAR